MDQQLPPLLLLRQYSQAFPRAWRQIAEMRQQRGKSLPWWPDWCYAPISASAAVVTGGASKIGPAEIATAKEYPPAVMAGLAAWRITKGVYRFDDTLRQEIADMPLEGDLPAEIFYSLPEWCIYVETPGMTLPFIRRDVNIVEGFFAFLEYDLKDGRSELRLNFYMPDSIGLSGSRCYPQPLHLGKWTVAQAVRKVFQAIQMDVDPPLPADEQQEFYAETAAGLTPFINMVLYICSLNADFGGERPAHPSRRPASKKGKIFAANEVRTWEVGIRVGPALRQALAAEQPSSQPSKEASLPGRSHASPRPHYRRAHWHHYWTGPKSNPVERKLILKWLPPIPVGIPEFDDVNNMPAVIRPIKKGPP